MKDLKHIIAFNILILLILTSFSLHAQQECKVLSDKLSGEYTGGCKKGLANGIGEAIGTDQYNGSFKNGYPNGKGVYHYANGAVYDGEFVKGKRHGMGTLTFSTDSGTIEQKGFWEQDNYIGKKKLAPYTIGMKQNISRYSFIKTNDPRKQVMIKIQKNGNAVYPPDLMLSGNSGILIQQLPVNGFENVIFPFEGTIRYSLLNDFSGSTDYEIQFTIREPGSWVIILNH
ncbi:MAG: hypothetical protein H6540_02895 [Bacteroidales bacterium]|nr:hypothetical protein [Bacteroidales bacterium]